MKIHFFNEFNCSSARTVIVLFDISDYTSSIVTFYLISWSHNRKEKSDMQSSRIPTISPLLGHRLHNNGKMNNAND